jgi:hypothetical protein
LRLATGVATNGETIVALERLGKKGSYPLHLSLQKMLGRKAALGCSIVFGLQWAKNLILLL